MFSSRTRWGQTNRLTHLLAAKRRAGVPIVDLTETNPTAVGLTQAVDLPASLASNEALRYEPSARGLASARGAVAQDYARRGVAVDPDQIVLTASTSEAYAFLFKTLCDPGDSVLVPQPSYPLFEFLARLESVTVIPYPLRYGGGWQVDRGSLREALTPRCRAIVVVHPNNPTGSFIQRSEADELDSLCAARGLALISDEVFADYVFADGGAELPSLASFESAACFTLGGLSKSCGLPQLKLGWIAVHGPATLRAEALARLETVADTFLSVGTPVQLALPALLARLPELQAPIRERVCANRALLRQALPPDAPLSLLACEGGWSAVLRVPATLSEEQMVLRLLDEQALLVHPGYFFDFASEAFLVLSLLPAPAAFAEGVRRLRVAIEAWLTSAS